MKPIFTILCLLFPVLLPAQRQHQDIIDSLLKCLPNAKEDTTKIKILDCVAVEYRLIDPDEGIKYGTIQLAFATRIRWERGIALAYSALGLDYQYKSDYPKAYEYDIKALKAFEEAGDKIQVAHSLRNIANVYQYEKNYPKVIEYNLKAIKISEQLHDSDGISSNLVSMGIFFFSQHDYDSALAYDFKALDIAKQLHHQNDVALNFGNIGDVYLHKNDYTHALEYDLMSLKLFEELGDKYGTAIDLGNIGETYVTIAQDTSGKIITTDLIPASKPARLNKAIEYLNKAIAASKQIDQPDNIIEFSQYLSDAYELSGNYKNALESYKDYVIMNDSVYSLTNTAKIKQTEHAHDLELKDRDIKIARLAVAKKQNEQIFFIVGIVLLLIIIGVVFRYYNVQKETNKLLTKEKQRSENLLLNILPAEVADELKEKGTSTAKYFDNVTVMLTDFVDFTIAGERMSPQQLVDELHTCFKAFDEIIKKHGIEKIKTIGDGYLAVSGLPLPDPDHAKTMVSAALEINGFMRARKAKLGNNTFEVRIGIHSGSVVAGIVGVIKFAYDIWGDTVNTAARMEENSSAGKINISQTTYELVKDKFTCTYRGEIQAKNKGVMKMYFIENP